MRINATTKEDWGSHELKLHFSFVEYPSSTANNDKWIIDAHIDYCFVQQWIAPSNFQVEFVIGQKSSFVEWGPSQAPCSYGAAYTTKLLYKNDVYDFSTPAMPSFITQDTRSPFWTILTNSTADIGWYVIEVTATLDVFNYLGDLNTGNDPDHTPAFLNTWLKDGAGTKIYGTENVPSDFLYKHSFNITVGIIEVNTTSITEDNNAPFLMPKPEKTHKLIAGQAWQYQLGVINDFEGDNVVASVQLRNAEGIIQFDADTLTLWIDEGATNE